MCCGWFPKLEIEDAIKYNKNLFKNEANLNTEPFHLVLITALDLFVHRGGKNFKSVEKIEN